MDAIEALTQKVSVPKLVGPAPSRVQLSTMFQAAFRAPDHALLTPWRYITIEGHDALEALGDVMLQAALLETPDMPEDKRQKVRDNPKRAPMVVVAVVRLTENPKVPEIEQWLSVGASIQNLQTAAWAEGYASIWRTGPLAFSRAVCEGLGLESHEHIAGFIYIGQPDCRLKAPPERLESEFVTRWPAK